MTALNLVLIAAGAMLAVGLLTVLAWLISTWYLDRAERRLATRKGLYRDLVTDLANGEPALLGPTIHEMSTLYDLDALEAVLEEQARSANGRPRWLLEAYDQLGLVDKYIDKLRSARKWSDRAFAAELLGRVGDAKAVPALLETVEAVPTEGSDVREVSLRALVRITDPDAVEPLIGALATAEAWLAPRIADILTQHGELVVDPLIAVLNDSSRQPARAWAAYVLGEVRAQRAFPSLVRSLGDPEDEVRAKAATALGRLGDRRAVGYLLEHLLTDPAPLVRARIASTLGQFGGPEVIDRLVRALGDPAWWVRMRSVEALEQIGAVAEGPLFVALDDVDPGIRVRAAVALERLGVPDNLVRMIESGERVPEASATLMKFAASGTREFLAALAQHPLPQVRETVVTAAQRAERRDLVDELLQIASGDSEAPLRALAFRALRSLGLRDALPAAMVGLSDPDQPVRAAAVGLLGDLDQLLDSPDVETKLALIRALRRSRRSEAVPVLERLLGDHLPAVRAAAIEALERTGRSGSERELAATAVNTGLQDPDDGVRASAIDARGRVEGQQHGQELLTLLEDDPSPLVRERAALAIGLRRVPDGEGALNAACRRAEPPNVRAAAALAAGVFGRQSAVARVVEMPDQAAVREVLRERLKRDAQFRLLAGRLSSARHLEIRALGTLDDQEAQASLAHGMRSILDAGDRISLISSLRAFQGDQTRGALLQIVREDPIPEVRTAALDAVRDLLDAEELLAVGTRSLGDPSGLVRRAAVALFTRVTPASALARLIQLLRVDDDSAVLAAAAALAEEHFPLFAQAALELPPGSTRAELVIRIARHIVHPDLPGLLPPFARSSSPEVRAAVIDLWRSRPDIADPASLEALTVDPELSVRRGAVGAALAAARYDLLDAMIQDPAASVRREVAIVLGGAVSARNEGLVTLDRLAADPDMTVRAAAYVAHLVQGVALPLPPGLDSQVAAQAVKEGADLPSLQQAARTASSEERRLAAALALALLQDEVAREVARTDPVPSIRHRVGGTLELSIVSLPEASPGPAPAHG